jgi:hypothetical protein
MVKKILKILGIIFLAVILLLVVGALFLHEARPEPGRTGPEADALARKIEQAVNKAAWDSTGAVSWVFAGQHELLWDKKRHLARVRWQDKEVLINLHTRKGIAYRNGQRLSEEEAQKPLQQAWEWWANDSFWLNPLAKLFDKGVSRSIVTVENGEPALMVSYGSGGVTPGDAYVWILGEDYLPTAWKMWVSVVPIGGIRIGWEEWKTLSTGAKVATHHGGIFPIDLTEVRAARELSELEPEDPFRELKGD